MKEYILCAAIWYKELPLLKTGFHYQNPKNVYMGIVFCGHRHVHCMYSMISITGKRSVTSEVGEYIQGFLTSENRFVGREDGAKIAFAAKQIKVIKNTLYSEDLY